MNSTATSVWLWIGFGGVFIGSLIILYLTTKMRRSDNYHGLLALLITTIATLAYFALARGQATLVFGGETIYLGRYLDWVITTPLLLISLMVLALPASTNASTIRARTKLMLSVIIADVLMITTGLFANLSTTTFDTVVWYIVSCIWFVVVLWLMFTVVRQNAYASGLNNGKLYTTMLSYLTVLWVVYPIVWLLGSSGTNVFSVTTETAAYAILDISAKAVFGIALLTKLHTLERYAQPKAGETTTDAA